MSDKGDTKLELNLADEFAGDTLGERAQEPDKRTPFDFFIFDNLLAQETLDELRKDVHASVALYPKDNDLYNFKQSQDLRSEVDPASLTPLVRSFTQALVDQVRPRLEQLSGLKLSATKFDVTLSHYLQGEYLLCHNDDMKDPTQEQARALAFVYYFNERPWSSSDGGALILYDSDTSGEPIGVNNYIYPKPNTLVVFRTSPTSWHSVQEVLCRDDTRKSINGWFHLDQPSIVASHTAQEQDDAAGALSSSLSLAIEPCPYTFHRPVPLDERLERFFAECISGEYLMEKTCFMIRRKFKRQSELSLPNFLVKEKYAEIAGALREAAAQSDNLQQVGPYNKRNYQRFHVDKLPAICRDLFDALRSELFFMLLARFTGLDLQPAHLAHEKLPSDDDDDNETTSGGDEEDSEDSVESEDEQDDEENSEKADEEEVESDEGEVGGGGQQEEGGKVERTEEETASTSKASAGAQEGEEETQRDNDKQPRQARKRKERQANDPIARLEFRHLTAGAYTLIHDHNFELAERSALDVMLHFNHDFKAKFDRGGYISYLDISGADADPEADADAASEAGAGEDLLTVEPESNSLNLVYRSDGSTCRFLKYISRKQTESYQDLSCVYYERPEDLPESSCVPARPASPSDQSPLKRTKTTSSAEPQQQ